MLVSIIIPIYNKEIYLNHCIKSVVDQEYSKLEIILINDGSVDKSEEIIKKWDLQDNRIRYISQENKGVASTRNKGMLAANGKYIFFLDADDYLEKNAISKLVDCACQSKADIIIGNFYEKTGSNMIKKPNFESKLYNKEDLLLTNTLLEMFIVNARHMAKAGNKLYKLDFLKDNQISFIDGVIAEDRLFNLMCYVNRPMIQVINNYTYVYNILENSRSRTLSPNFYEQNIALLECFYDYLIKKSKLNQNLGLFQLTVLYDVHKVINQTFENGKKKITLTNRTIKELRGNFLVYDTVSNVIKQRKFENVGGKSFSSIRLINYLLLKAPYAIPLYKILGYTSRKVKIRQNVRV